MAMAKELLSINVRNALDKPISHHAVTYGVPLAEGVLRECDKLALRLANGQLAPVQTRVLERHFDGSVKWLLLDFDMPLEASQTGKVALIQGRSVAPAEDLRVEETDERVTVTTANLCAAIGKRRFSLFESYLVNGKEMTAPGSDIIVETLKGKRFYASDSKGLDVRVIESGHRRVVVQVTGRHTAGDGSEMLTFRVRCTFRPHEPGVAVSYKFTNAEPPERGVHLGSIRILLPTALGRETTKHVRQRQTGEHWLPRIVEISENVEMIAGDPAGDEGRNRYGEAAGGSVVMRDLDTLREDLSKYSYYLRPDNPRAGMGGGLRQTYPYLAADGEGGSVVAWFCEMSQNFPKGISCDRNVLTFDVWPAWPGELHLRRGMSKEHDLYVSLADTRRTALEMEAIYFERETAWAGEPSPVELTLDPDYVRSTRVLELHRWLRCDEERYMLVEAKLSPVLKGQGPLGRGMLDYGDYVPDRNRTHNNENDPILDLMRDYYRRGEHGSLLTAIVEARHNAHVDFIAYDPNPLRQGTMPAHCPEHTDGATYPSHMWADGLMAAYCVSGEPDFREAALSVGENMLRWQKDDPIIFYETSRESGWPMLAFLRLHEHTGEQRWLDACREVFEFYRRKAEKDGRITYHLPFGVGLFRQGYGEFISWRACFFYYERTGDEEVKDFLIKCLSDVEVYKRELASIERGGGWACNDLFPAWAVYTLTGDDRYIEDNYNFFRVLMRSEGKFPFSGVDVHFYLNELDRRGVLEELQA